LPFLSLRGTAIPACPPLRSRVALRLTNRQKYDAFPVLLLILSRRSTGPPFDIISSGVLCSSTHSRQRIVRGMKQSSRASKLRRIKRKHRPRVLDLFAGCGGFSLGFLSAGFRVVGAVESDPLAVKSHALNFCNIFNTRQFELHSKPRDITELEPEELVGELSLGEPTDAVDVIIGGPPCQAFARVGRAKLREIASHPKAFLKDPGDRYPQAFRHVRKLFGKHLRKEEAARISQPSRGLYPQDTQAFKSRLLGVPII